MKIKQEQNNRLSFFEIALSVLLCFTSMRVFLPYSGTGILGIVPFIGALILVFGLSALVKNVFSVKDFVFYLCVLIWIGWFSVCLKAVNFVAYDIKMIICIGVVFICAVTVIKNCNVKCIVPMVILVCVFSTITIAISMPIISENEMAVREYAAGITDYSRSGLGGYEFVYCLSMFCPCLLLLFKVFRGWQKVLIGVVIAASIVYSASCGLFITFIINISSISLYLIVKVKNKKHRKLLIYFIVAVVIMFMLLGSQLLIQSLTYINENIDNSALNMKISDMIRSLSGEEEEYGTFSSRAERYGWSFATFMKSPVLGGFVIGETKISGSHSTLLDYMAITGALGFGIFFWMFVTLYKTAANQLKNELSKSVLWIVFGMFMMTAFFKGVSFASIFWVVLVVVPLTVRMCDSMLSRMEGSFLESFAD